jgi:hypothetical protein
MRNVSVKTKKPERAKSIHIGFSKEIEAAMTAPATIAKGIRKHGLSLIF